MVCAQHLQLTLGWGASWCKGFLKSWEFNRRKGACLKTLASGVCVHEQ